MDRNSNSLRYHGMLSEATKKPAKSIKGMMRTGVRVTASYLSEKEAEMMRE